MLVTTITSMSHELGTIWTYETEAVTRRHRTFLHLAAYTI